MKIIVTVGKEVEVVNGNNDYKSANTTLSIDFVDKDESGHGAEIVSFSMLEAYIRVAEVYYDTHTCSECRESVNGMCATREFFGSTAKKLRVMKDELEKKVGV